MSAYEKYNHELLHVERSTGTSAALGSLILGQAALGATSAGWVALDCAALDISGGYSPDQNGTLIVDETSASLQLASWSDPGLPFHVGDRIRVRYDNVVLFEGLVDTHTFSYEADPAVAAHSGSTRKYIYSATVSDVNWVAMHRVVSWEDELPEELAHTRVSRFVTVEGWNY